jgi:hypothetical protein
MQDEHQGKEGREDRTARHGWNVTQNTSDPSEKLRKALCHDTRTPVSPSPREYAILSEASAGHDSCLAPEYP